MTAHKEMNCKELVELVTDYLEGALPPGDRNRFEKHLRECPDCGTYLDQMRQTVRALGRLSEDLVPAEAKETLLETFRNWKQTRSC
jgi:anti-sigma factor RsiW